MYRYSRGQPGQGSLPRPAWGSGSGSHGARTSSPEPGSAGTPISGGAALDPSRERSNTQDEVILQLETELSDLRNACAIKDQRIAELSRTDTPAARLKRDVRIMADELHRARRELREAMNEMQELRAEKERGEAAGDRRDTIDSPSAPAAGSNSGGAGRGNNSHGADRDREKSVWRMHELEEENRSLREAISQLKAENLQRSHSQQPSGASSQRVSDAQAPSSVAHPSTPTTATPPAGAASGSRQSYLNQTAAFQASTPATTVPASSASGTPTSAASALPNAAMQEEPLRPLVYSSHNAEHAATIGPTMLQGVGTVDGVAMVAKVLLQRIHSSVCSQARRPQHGQHPMGSMGQVPQQLMVQQMPMT